MENPPFRPYVPMVIEKAEQLKTLMKTTDTSCLVKKTGYYTKPGKIENKILHHDHDKYINTQEFNKLTADNFLRD